MTKANNRNVEEKYYSTSTIIEFNKDGPSQVQKMKVLNALLEERIEQQATQLTEIVTSNTQFISIIAHDLRSPFGSILGALEVLKRNLAAGDKDDIEMLVNIAAESTRRTLTLLDNLLTWTFYQKNGNSFVPDKVKFDLHQMVKTEIDLYEDIAIQKQINLFHNLEGELIINADSRMIATVIRNLIDNAIKYTKPGGLIFIHTLGSEEFLGIIIKDNGIGMSNEAQESFLKPDALKSTNSSQKAGGLGLILCKELVQIHNGSLTVESGRGIGSQFTVTLPRGY